MNDERFRVLTARVLDDELCPTEGEELIAWLRQNPAAGVEVRQHLQLWELFSQQVCAERSSGAFAAACRTRLLAEADERKFISETEEKLRRSVESGIISRIASTISKSRSGGTNLGAPASSRQVAGRTSGTRRRDASAPRAWQDRLRQWVARWLTLPRWALATAGVIISVLVLPGFLRTQGVPELASGTEVQLQISRGGKSVVAEVGLRLQPNDVLRTADGSNAVISYGREATRLELEPNSELKILAWKNGKRFNLHAGKLEASVAHQRSFHPMIITTPQAEARVLGTKFSLLSEADATRLEVTQGKVKLLRTSDSEAVKVPSGYYAIAATNTELAAQPLTGSILREYWTNLPGGYYVTLLTDHPAFPDHPSGREYLNNFESPSGRGTNYGARIRGYLHPPRTGEYTFWIAVGDGAELWFSPDDHPAHKRPIGNADDSAPYQWAKLRKQQSPVIPLVAGRKYYIEALQKQGVKQEDHLAVAWHGPGREREVIPGKFLSPVNPKPKNQK